MEFKIKRDFIPLFLFNAFLLLIAACSVIFFARLDDNNYLTWFIIVLVVDLLILILYNLTVIIAKCYITEDKLIYKRGFTLKYSIPLDRIAKVTEVRNLYPSLSLSTKKLRILVVGETGKQCVYYISVADNRKLMSILKPNPELKNVKDELVKPADTPVEEPKAEAKQEEIVTATDKQVVATPKTTAKSTATTKKPATKKTTTATKATTAKKTTSTKKAN